jgi:hypothetical protein
MDENRLVYSKIRLNQLKQKEHAAWIDLYGNQTILRFPNQPTIALYSEERYCLTKSINEINLETRDKILGAYEIY